jgi:hypothetical protein
MASLLSSSMYYKDFMGVTYGPFDDMQVKEWWKAGYFNDRKHKAMTSTKLTW